MEAKEVGLATICKGAIPEIFALEFQKILDDIADPNTSAKKVRKLNLEFTFTPYPDRSGAVVGVAAKAVRGDLDTSGISGTIHLAKVDGKYRAFSRDLRQEMLFSEEKPPEAQPPDGKTAAGGA
jgi:hypothetical protein